MSIGFDHSKLRYMYDEEGTQKKLLETVGHIGKDKEILFIEGGRDLSYGMSVYLDTLSLAKYTGSLVIVVQRGGGHDSGRHSVSEETRGLCRSQSERGHRQQGAESR